VLSNQVFRILQLFMHILCTILVMIFLIVALHPYVFTHIIWVLLCQISWSNMFALMFLTLFSL